MVTTRKRGGTPSKSPAPGKSRGARASKRTKRETRRKMYREDDDDDEEEDTDEEMEEQEEEEEIIDEAQPDAEETKEEVDYHIPDDEMKESPEERRQRLEKERIEKEKKKEEREKKQRLKSKGKFLLEVDYAPEPTATAILADSTTKPAANTGLTPQWIEMVDKLKAYKEKFGDTRVPSRYKDDPALSSWVKQQRKQYVRQELSDGQRVSLESLGFEFIIEETDKPALTWDESFEQLQTFKEKHGHTEIPQNYEEMPVLQFWTFYQREMYRKGQLTKEQIAKLEGLGFSWDHKWSTEKAKPKSLEEVWNMQFEKLKAFKEKEGHCNVPGNYLPDPRFGRWIETQRTTYRRNQMPEERLKALEDLGFEWNRTRNRSSTGSTNSGPRNSNGGKSNDEIWRMRFEDLKEFKAQNGHTNVPGTYFVDPVLGRWVGTQRTTFRRGQMAQDRIDALTEIGFEFRVKDAPGAATAALPENDASWGAMFEKLEAYKEEHGNVDVPRSYAHDQILARWVAAQRRAKQQNQMPEDRHHQLDSIGFKWENPEKSAGPDSNEAIWNTQFEKLRLFRELNGHCNVPKDYNIDPAFGRWVQTQRTTFRRDAMTEERKEALLGLGFEFRLREAPSENEQDEIWNMQLEKLKIFKEANGHCNVPGTYTVDSTLARWVGTQRTTYRRKQMTEERKQALECLGFEWRLGPPQRTWGENFALLSKFKEEHGHPHFISKGSGDKTLHNWIVNQRQKFAKGQLSQEQIQQLQSIGFAWTTEQEKLLLWDYQFEKLKQFQGENGHCGIPTNFPEDPDLLDWISQQHNVYFAKKMPPERVEKLVSIGFIFNNDGGNNSMVADDERKSSSGGRVSWNKHFESLKAFKELHGHTHVPYDYHLDTRLGRWVHNQRKLYEKGVGPREDRMEKLNSIEFDWTAGAAAASAAAGVAIAPGYAATTPETEVDVLMRAAEAAASPAATMAAPTAATPAVTWQRTNSQSNKAQAGVTQMAVRLEVERTKLDRENRELKRNNKNLQTMNENLTKRLTDAEAAFKMQSKELNDRLQYYDEQFKAQAETLESQGQQLAQLVQQGQERYEEQLREQSQTVQSQGNQLSQLAQQVQDMRQVQYTLQHQVGLQNLSYRL